MLRVTAPPSLFLGDFGSQLKIWIGFSTRLHLLFCKKEKKKEKKKMCSSFHSSGPESSSGGIRQQQDGELLPRTALHIGFSSPAFYRYLFLCLCYLKKRAQPAVALRSKRSRFLSCGGSGSRSLEVQVLKFWRFRI